MQTDASLLLSRDNLDVQKLRSFVTEVADHTGTTRHSHDTHDTHMTER